ncbi:MAG: spore coat biosynthesis protein F, partial [Pacificimonas sp.]
AAHPNGQKRFYEFTDGAVSTTNAYLLSSPKALDAVETFRGGGQFVKHPCRILKAFGLMNLIRFRLGWGRLDTTFARIGRRLGLKIVPVILPDGAAAIDVDHDRSLRVTEEVLAARA